MAKASPSKSQAKPAEVAALPPAPEDVEPIPATGPGPLGGYPVPPGATHWRLHGCDSNARITQAITLDHDDDGEPITRASIGLIGDARWWDVLPASGVVRVVFLRMHGDRVIKNLGQGPVWTPPRRGEGTVKGQVAAAPEAAKPEDVVINSEGGGLFMMLCKLQDIADAKAQREIQAAREVAQQQRQADRDFMRGMFEISIGARREDRRDKDRSERSRAQEIATAVAAAVAEARDDEDDDDDDEDEKKETSKVQEQADLIGRALTGLGENLKPILSELAKRAASGSVG